ncbi:MAG: hypothetical protein J6R47_05740 [Acholeplasmatales bacterium]|nr:hypothetical protein [Acholeplasmatales bacterium]
MDNYEQSVYVKLMTSIRPDIDYLFQIFEAYKYFTTDEIRDAITSVIGLVASGRKMRNENTEID